MRYNDNEIKRELREFVLVTSQSELRYVIAYAMGYFGCITNQVWEQIQELMREGIIK